MQRKSKNGVHWLEFDLLADIPNLKHGVFLRHGGESTGAYDSLNVGDNTGDHLDVVARNRHKVLQTTNLSSLAWMQQCHGNNIQEVKEVSSIPLLACDGLISNRNHMGLVVAHADCQAAVMYDPVQKAIASVHCGWRGSVQNIYAKAIGKMQKIYRTKPQNLLVGISPSLGPSSAQFLNYRTELPEVFWPYQVTPQYFDFWEISTMQLKKCGVLPHHIEIAKIDTFSNSSDWFSYRRDKITGRHGTFIGLSS